MRQDDKIDIIDKAVLTYVTPPTDAQLEGIRKFLAGKYNNEKIEIECVEDQSIVSGFVIRAGNDEYDWSERVVWISSSRRFRAQCLQIR